MVNVRTAADIGETIRAARVAQGLNQTELARRAGVKQPKVSEIERGKDTAHIGIALRMIAALGLTIDIAGAGTADRHQSQSGKAAKIVFDEPLPDDTIDLDVIVGGKARPRDDR
jgi:transcriptional regulator with XRE-family HTH domain